jgi:hypothetical protein
VHFACYVDKMVSSESNDSPESDSLADMIDFSLD